MKASVEVCSLEQNYLCLVKINYFLFLSVSTAQSSVSVFPRGLDFTLFSCHVWFMHERPETHTADMI